MEERDDVAQRHVVLGLAARAIGECDDVCRPGHLESVGREARVVARRREQPRLRRARVRRRFRRGRKGANCNEVGEQDRDLHLEEGRAAAPMARPA